MNAATNLTQGERYSVEYSCRDIGDGVEEGEDVFVYRGRESGGKHTFEPTNGGPAIYLFDDEIVSAEPWEAPVLEDVWQYAEAAPEGCKAVADLWHWSTNYDAACGPISLFLDMIGYSNDEFGSAIYAPTVRLTSDVPNRIADDNWDQYLGYVELGKLAEALTEYANGPQDVRAWIDGLMQYEEA